MKQEIAVEVAEIAANGGNRPHLATIHYCFTYEEYIRKSLTPRYHDGFLQ